MPLSLRLTVAALTLFYLVVPAHAQQTITVGPGTMYPTIQSGIVAASAGDTIMVASGTYKENLTISKVITLQAQTAGAVTIDGGGPGTGQHTVITISGNSSLKTTVSGFHIVNGVSGSTASAGIAVTNAGATIAGNTFSNNANALTVTNGSVTFSGNQINTVIGNGSGCDSGSGIRLTGSSTVVDGSGLAVPTVIEGNTITGPSTASCSTGIGIEDGQDTELHIQFNKISGQQQAIVTSPANGQIFITGNLIHDNANGGLEIKHELSTPPAGPADTYVVNNTFANNLIDPTTSFGGPGTGPAELLISQGTYSKIALINNLFSANSADPILDCFGSAPFIGTNAPANSNQVTPIILDHNLFNNAGGGPIGADGCPVTATTLGSNVTVTGTPTIFVSATDFHLAGPGSPAVDAGNNVANMPFTDLDNVARPQNATGKPAPIVDIGAYEYAGTQSNGPISTLTVTVPGSVTATSSPYYTTLNSITLNIQLLSSNSLSQSPLSAAPGQTVTVFENGTALPGTYTTDSNGAISISPLILTSGAGLYAFTATYAGSATYPAAASTVIYVELVNPPPPSVLTLTTSQTPSPYGSPVTFTVTSNSGDGTHPAPVTLTDGAANGVILTTFQSADLATGTATYTTSTLTAGTHTITATFAGDSNHGAASVSIQQVITGAPATLTLTSSLNPAPALTAVTFTAQLMINGKAAPAGNSIVMTITGNGAPAIPALTTDATGSATFTTSTLTPGQYIVGASFAGSADIDPATAPPLTEIITTAPAVLTITSSLNPAPALTSVTFTAHLTVNGQPAPAGNSIVMTIGGSGAPAVPALMTDANGNAVFTTAALTPGTYPVGASFSGTTTIASATATTLNEVVAINPTTTTLTVAPQPGYQNQTVTFTATVMATTGTAPPAGTVALFNGATQVASVNLTPATGATSAATFPVTGLAPGDYTFTAVYTPSTPNPSFLPSQSAPPLQVTILPQDFTLALSESTIIIQTEHHGSLTLTLNSIGGFASTLQLSCGTLPQYVTCEIANAALPLAANGTATTKLTLDTDTLLNFASVVPGPGQPSHLGRVAWAGLLPLLLLGIRRRKPLPSLAKLMLLGVLGMGLTACSGHFPDHTPPGTYTINITATGTPQGGSMPTTHTVPLTLVVTP